MSPNICVFAFLFFAVKPSSALLERWDWERTLPVECNVPSPLLAGASMWRNANGAVHMAHLNVGLVQADDIDTAFSDAMGGLCVSDVRCYLTLTLLVCLTFAFNNSTITAGDLPQ